MALFKKTKKKSPEQKYCESLMEQIGFAAAKGKYAIYVSAKDEEEDWLLNFCSMRNYEVRASHNTDGVNYYKIWNFLEQGLG